MMFGSDFLRGIESVSAADATLRRQVGTFEIEQKRAAVRVIKRGRDDLRGVIRSGSVVAVGTYRRKGRSPRHLYSAPAGSVRGRGNELIGKITFGRGFWGRILQRGVYTMSKGRTVGYISARNRYGRAKVRGRPYRMAIRHRELLDPVAARLVPVAYEEFRGTLQVFA